jgi:Uma2 family endonuclease
MSTFQRITADELLRMSDDGTRRELVRGVMRHYPYNSALHGTVALNIGAALATYVHAHDLGIVYGGGTGFIVATNPDTVRAPDAAFVRRERAEVIGDEENYFPGAPDLAIEVISYNDLYIDVMEKITDFLDAGTRMILVIDPHSCTVAMYRSTISGKIMKEADTIDGEDVVPGWTCAVRDVFV